MPAKKKPEPLATLIEGDTEKAYEAFVQNLEVFTIGLVSCECKIDRKAFFDIKQRIQSFSHEYELTKHGADYFDATGRFSVGVTDAKDSPPVLTVQCSFQAHIHGKGPISKQHAERFANSELKLVMVPFARQFVANISNQMAVPPVILPLTRRVSSRPVKATRAAKT
jgi:hypothetical protein